MGVDIKHFHLNYEILIFVAISFLKDFFFKHSKIKNRVVEFQFQLIFIILPWKSSVHKFISTIWQAVNGHNFSWHESPLPFLWVSKKGVGPLFMAWLETINDNSTQHIAQDGWKIKLIYLKMLLYIYKKKRVLNWPP